MIRSLITDVFAAISGSTAPLSPVRASVPIAARPRGSVRDPFGGRRPDRRRQRPLRAAPAGKRDDIDRSGSASGTDGTEATDRSSQPVSAAALTRAEAREILAVGLTADQAEIRAAYRRQVKRVHPDNGGDRTAFMRVTAAYERLAGDR